MTDLPTLITRALARPLPASETATFDELGVDGLDLICIRQVIEEEHGFDLTDSEVERWRSVADVEASVRGRVG